MRKFVAVKIDGEISVHMAHDTGNYYTLCGMDGNDDNPSVNQITVDVPEGAKINCGDCRSLFDACRLYRKNDFALSNPAPVGRSDCICVDFLNFNPDPVANPDCPIHGSLRPIPAPADGQGREQQ